MKYEIVRKCVSANHWQVWWNDELVYESRSEVADQATRVFADGLERGITGSKQALQANSRIRLEGWRDYLEGFDSYEDYKG